MLVERLHRQSAGIGRGLEHQRRHRADEHSHGDAFRSVTADVAGHFAAAGGVADVDRALQIELFRERRQVVRVRIHLVSIPGLARPAMAAPVMGDAAIPPAGQKQHLVFPGIRTQRPSVAEDHRLSRAPVLVINLSSIFRGNRRHNVFSVFLVVTVSNIATGRRPNHAASLSLHNLHGGAGHPRKF